MGIRISEMEEATTFGADDYVPIVTNGTNKKAIGAKIKDFIAGFFVNKSGDTMSGDLSINATNAKTKCINPDMILDTSANNNLSADSDYGVSVTDKNGAVAGSFNVSTRANGQVVASITANNKETNGTDTSNYIAIIMAKNGTRSYYVPDKEAFRSAIGVKSITVENKSITTGLPTIAANSVSSININVSKTDYSPAGIMGITGTGTTGLVIQEYYLTGTTATVYFRNVTSSSITPSVIRVTVLYLGN